MIRKLYFFGGKKRARAQLYVFGEFEPLTRLLDRHDISIRKRLGPSHARHVTFFYSCKKKNSMRHSVSKKMMDYVRKLCRYVAYKSSCRVI